MALAVRPDRPFGIVAGSIEMSHLRNGTRGQSRGRGRPQGRHMTVLLRMVFHAALNRGLSTRHCCASMAPISDWGHGESAKIFKQTDNLLKAKRRTDLLYRPPGFTSLRFQNRFWAG